MKRRPKRVPPESGDVAPPDSAPQRARRKAAAPDRPVRPARSPRRPTDETAAAERPARRARPADEEPDSDPAETKVCGLNACLVLYRQRPAEIVRGWFSERVLAKCGPLMKSLAARHKAYHVVDDEELRRVSGSTHHEGVCLLVRRTPPVPAEEWLARHASEPGPRTIVALEQVGNPHNLGALLRTCAHFGVRTVVVDDAESLLSGAAMRTAEGGAEFVEIVAAERIDRFVAEARRRGWRIAATSSREGADLFRTELPARCIVLFGEEAHGLSKKLLSEADVRLRVPGTSQVESLNVSAAAAVILGEFWRRRPG